MRSSRMNTGLLKSISSSDSGVENSNSSPSWNKRLNPRLRSSKRRSRSARSGRIGIDFGLLLLASARLLLRACSASSERAASACSSGNSACTRVPSPGQGCARPPRPRCRSSPARRTAGSRCGRCGHRAGAGNRRSRWPWPRWSAGLRVWFFWRMATAGAMPSIRSTSGFSMRSRNCRA